MNANRLINMILRMVMRKGMNHIARQGGNTGQSKEARQAAKRARQTAKLTRRL